VGVVEDALGLGGREYISKLEHIIFLMHRYIVKKHSY
jgi:hypothetical protein